TVAERKQPEEKQPEKKQPETKQADRKQAEPAAKVEPEPAPDLPAGELRNAYELLRRATSDLTRGGGPARDSDVKRRMLELNASFDESNYGFSKFSRFLRQAHDAEVVTLRKL